MPLSTRVVARTLEVIRHCVRGARKEKPTLLRHHHVRRVYLTFDCEASKT